MFSPLDSGISVAVIDPDFGWASDLANELKQRGANVTTYSSARDLAADVLSEFDVLVIGRDADPGCSALSSLRAKYDERTLPVIFASDDDRDEVMAARAGANAVFDRTMHDSSLMEKLVFGLGHI